VDIIFLITTYNRQESCQRLVDLLQGIGDILVLNDGCDYEIKGCRQVFQKQHYGRLHYFATVNNLFSLRGRHSYYIMLPDDFLMDKEQVEEAIRLWQTIVDGRKICLNLFADRMGMSCWTGFKPIIRYDLWLTQWVDMCFLCQERFFTELGIINESRFRGGLNKKSSGVGSYISSRFYHKRLNLYQVRKSLVTPQETHFLKSQMQNHDNYSDGVHTIPPSKFTRIHR